MRRGDGLARLRCPTCGAGLGPLDEPAESNDSVALWCPDCQITYRARPRAEPAPRPRPRPKPTRRPIGGFALFWRSWLLRLVFRVYRVGLGLGTLGVFLLGGFVPVTHAWLLDRLNGWTDVAATLGGVPIRLDPTDPDADFGPILKRAEAPPLLDLIAGLARDLNIRPPEEVRLAFLPCCGVVAWRRSRALLLGLPLLSVLDVAELRAVLAHEFAHLARGDATWSARLVRSVEILDRGLNQVDSPAWGPLRWWAIGCRGVAVALLAPIAEGQEARADRISASLAGGRSAADALVKVALVQPLFRELLSILDIDNPAAKNLYASFRTFWGRLPEPLLDAMRLNLLTSTEAVDQSPHPPLADRIARLIASPDGTIAPADRAPALALLGDSEWLEQMLHDRLYKLHPIEPSVFHAAGS